MIRYLIKNNFKIMFRNAINILMFVLCPIIVSAVLISAFSTLLESYKPVSSFEVGYRVEENCEFEKYIDSIVDVGKENGITFIEYNSGTPKTIVDDYGLGGFVTFDSEGYTVYESEDKCVEGSTLEYMLSAVFKSSITKDTGDISINVEFPDHAAAVDSTDYYGIIYIVYFGGCAIVCAAGLYAQEKKNRINERLKVSNLSSVQIYLSKLIPIASVVFIGIGAAAILMAILLGVHWGNIALSAVILLLSVLAATAFEMMIYEITNSMIATIILSFGIVWIMGFIGGSFETYMFSAFPESLKNMSPIYHVNRALVELSSMGKSDYISSAILYTSIITIVSSLVSVAVGSIRRSDR